MEKLDPLTFVKSSTGDPGTYLSDERALIVFCPGCDRPVGVKHEAVDWAGQVTVDFGECGGIQPVILDQWQMPSRAIN